MPANEIVEMKDYWVQLPYDRSEKYWNPTYKHTTGQDAAKHHLNEWRHGSKEDEAMQSQVMCQRLPPAHQGQLFSVFYTFQIKFKHDAWNEFGAGIPLSTKINVQPAIEFKPIYASTEVQKQLQDGNPETAIVAEELKE